MVLDGSELICKVLLHGIIPNAIYCSRVRDINVKLSAAVVSSGAKLYQLTPQQGKLAREKGIMSSLFGKVCFVLWQHQFGTSHLHIVTHDCFNQPFSIFMWLNHRQHYQSQMGPYCPR